MAQYFYYAEHVFHLHPPFRGHPFWTLEVSREPHEDPFMIQWPPNETVSKWAGCQLSMEEMPSNEAAWFAEEGLTHAVV